MNPDPLYVDDEPWPLYPDPAPDRLPLFIAAAFVAVLALIAWRRHDQD